MKNLLRLEELAQFLLCAFLLVQFHSWWWWFGLLLIGPDISMLGYLIDSKWGSVLYNVIHHKALPLLILVIYGLLGPDINNHGNERMFENVFRACLVLFGHSSMDRALGFGLKYSDDFKHTHLGWIGKSRKSES